MEKDTVKINFILTLILNYYVTKLNSVIKQSFFVVCVYTGLVFVDGEFFKEQKQFCMRHLKLLGLYNSSMEDRISFETNELVNNIKKHKVRLPF